MAAPRDHKPWLFGEQPTVADCAVFGLVAPFVFAPFDTPVARYASSLKPLADWCRQVKTDHF
jgi:glutathione S-transferase